LGWVDKNGPMSMSDRPLFATDRTENTTWICFPSHIRGHVSCHESDVKFPVGVRIIECVLC